MRASAFLQLYNGIDQLNVDEGARESFRKYLSRFAAMQGVEGVERAERIAFVRRLLAERVSRTTIKERLMAHHEISKSQAYRVIEDAMKTVA